MKQDAGRIAFIDVLRGLAALAVVLFHFANAPHLARLLAVTPAPLVGLLRAGHMGVQVFFVLSGFVIAHSLRGQDVDAAFFGRFLLRRSIRLDPPYWASIALVLAALVFNHSTAAVPPASTVAAHLFYLQDLLGLHPLSAIYWTLCLEIQLYATFCLLMLVATRARHVLSPVRAFYAVVLPCVVVADLWPLGLGPFELRGVFLPWWHLFLAGVLVWWATTRPRDRVALGLAVGDLALLFVAAVARGEAETAVGACAAAAILLFGLRGSAPAWLTTRPLKFLGLISYSLYLVHPRLGGAALRAAFYVTPRGLVGDAVGTLLALAACIFGAWLFYLAVEKPALALARRIKVKPERRATDPALAPAAPLELETS